MSKAFDKVWHEGLIFKLKQNGIDGQLLTLLNSYLNNRKQRVVLNGHSSEWADILSGVPQGSVLGPLLFLIYVNDLEDGLKSKIKFFADDTSIYSIVKNPINTAEDMNHDLTMINQWAMQWKMCFNPDPTKPAEEILFSHKTSKVLHPPLFYNGTEVKRVNEHKHLGLILDPKLSFVYHVNEKISKAQKGIGLLKLLRPYLPLQSLDQIYKMHVRPHLDYCDIIYHIPIKSNDFDSRMSLNYQMDAIERIQYSAALAVTGTWQGTSSDKLYEELGWESLDQRRTFRRLMQFYKIMNSLTPDYLRDPVPPIKYHLFGRHHSNVLHPIICRNNRYRHSFFPNSVDTWNNLGPEMRSSPSLSVFKMNILKIIRPPKRDTYKIHNPTGIKWIFQLRVGLSSLNAHKKSHGFNDTPDETCICTLGVESTHHFFMDCPLYLAHRIPLQQLLQSLLLKYNMTNINSDMKVTFFLYGNEKFNFRENKSLLEATIEFIAKTSRLG